MRSDQVHIDSPCHESWDAMAGDSERRFCGVCEKHVHNLSAMRHDDAQELLRQSSGDNLCVRYSAEDDGTLRFRDLVPKSRLTRGIRRAAFAAVLLAGCSPQGNEPIHELADVAVSSIREAAVSTPDGGCNVTTGPFTTFHFPPGHALCGPADDAIAAQPVLPAIQQVMPVVQPVAPLPFPAVDPVPGVGPVPVIAAPVDPVLPAMPLPDPFPGAGEPEPRVVPRQQIEPIRPRPMMGRAIAHPEPVDPFVPCDPEPRFAPPPPPTNGFAPPPPSRFTPPPPTRHVPPKQPPIELMGDIAVPERPMVQGGIRPVEPPVSESGFAPPPR